MKLHLLFLFASGFCLFGCATSRRFFAGYAHEELQAPAGEVGTPLFLTPYIENGTDAALQEARELARVYLPDYNEDMNFESYSGYLTIDKAQDSNTFFWFFPAQINGENAPVTIWLEGGPGVSSMFGLLFESGPFGVDANMRLVKREHTWAYDHHMLYIDNPVGTGFSFTGSLAGYCRNETCVGESLYEAVQQFLDLFPQLRTNELYVTGESYAGKYVPALSYTIHKKNPTAEKHINFKGMAIGDGLTEPRNMTNYGDMLYGFGLLGDHMHQEFLTIQAKINQLMDEKQWMAAFKEWDLLLNGDETPYPTLFANATGLTNYFNFEHNGPPPGLGLLGQYLNLADVRRAIHVGNLTFHSGEVVEKMLLEDIPQGVKPWVEELLQDGSYKVMFYSGQNDIIVGYPLTRTFIRTLQWPGAEDFKNAPRNIWKVVGEVAGYVQSSGAFTEVLVRSAGHMVAQDQPAWALDLVRRFTGVYPRGFADL